MRGEYNTGEIVMPAGTPGPRSTPSTRWPSPRPGESPTGTPTARSEPNGPDSDELVAVGAAKEPRTSRLKLRRGR